MLLGVERAAEGAHWAATGTRGMRLMPRPRDRESNMKSHTGLVRLASCMHLRPARDATRLPHSVVMLSTVVLAESWPFYQCHYKCKCIHARQGEGMTP